MANLDISDLLILKEIHRSGSITRSVEHIGLSQPSISIRLNHLRKHFGDALFVRTSAGMQATPRMEGLLPKIEQALELLAPIGADAPFDPGTSTRTFRLGLAQVAQMALLPELVALLNQCAPGLRVESVELGPHTSKQLEAGEVDVAIGYPTELQAGVYQQRLMTEQYACVARCDHPRLGDSLSMHDFLAEEYVSVDAPATVHARLDKVLEERGIERKVKIKVSSLLGIGQMITSTNLLAILPSRVARTLEHDASIKVLKLPFSLPSYDVCQYWHERYHHEPGHIWFRQTIFETFLDMPLPA
ncbi:LysR family transcriptional regulator [Pusillimonas noertemannii]|uniref:DNA-binding transcriptional LysR family regulator n=1 Tax=Pusillimonas noertemannii TaxID=305977 RepID=A0A2U1CQX4_9BURK|nr:LysR family transcriptional regulator [Pusillimonas noertemannii]NYT67614.1 LysR family transcriptional regulator [Pusillimonas noertemannii]PVY68286.1 DNA-binding transcriptional LysR family regulator [Pusillimonas noertemannii]TFL12221.1 LysR family transcriptional regulator [Pusillimonas noertemannii]